MTHTITLWWKALCVSRYIYCTNPQDATKCNKRVMRAGWERSAIWSDIIINLVQSHRTWWAHDHVRDGELVTTWNSHWEPDRDVATKWYDHDKNNTFPLWPCCCYCAYVLGYVLMVFVRAWQGALQFIHKRSETRKQVKNNVWQLRPR